MVALIIHAGSAMKHPSCPALVTRVGLSGLDCGCPVSLIKDWGTGLLSRTAETVAHRARGLVEGAQYVFEATESVLGVLMLKCLRPLGVRDASEQFHLCPRISQARTGLATEAPLALELVYMQDVVW